MRDCSVFGTKINSEKNNSLFVRQNLLILGRFSSIKVHAKWIKSVYVLTEICHQKSKWWRPIVYEDFTVIHVIYLFVLVHFWPLFIRDIMQTIHNFLIFIKAAIGSGLFLILILLLHNLVEKYSKGYTHFQTTVEGPKYLGLNHLLYWWQIVKI